MRKIVIGLLIAVVGVSIASAVSLYTGENYSLDGSMFISDAGRSHGGFEYNAEYTATLGIRRGNGILQLALQTGLSDALEKHEYVVSNFELTSERLSMKVEGNQIILIWVNSDQIWDHQYDDHYIASWGSDAPPEEIRGTISPQIFLGLLPHYYIELRLKPPT